MYWVVSNMHLSGPFCCYMSHFCVMGTFCLCEDLSKEQFAHVIHWISPPQLFARLSHELCMSIGQVNFEGSHSRR